MHMKSFLGVVCMLALLLPGVSANAGVKGGPKATKDRVEARSTDVFNIVFVGEQVAQIGVKGDDDTDLDLLVYDELGNLVASDTDDTDVCIVRFRPKWTGPFLVK